MSCGWYFGELNQKESRQGDIPTKHAFDADIETFVREVLQNANDAGPADDDEPIEVTFRFDHISSGEGLEEFRRAFRWDDQLVPHLQAAADEEQDLSLQQFLENESEDLVLLTIEDKNTEGLSGAEDADESNYTALVRDMHRSNKDETQGGSHGVGGTVLWAFSGISTVLFTSVPASGESKPPRFVGRSYLPDHTIGGDLFKGYGWYGVPDSSDPAGRHVSAWAEEALKVTSTLGIGRPEAAGSSITVIGFREPGEGQPTGEQMEATIETIQQAAVENFWPAIRRQQLEVYVEGPNDESPRPANFETVDSVQPFVDAYHNLYEYDEEVGMPGDVASTDVTFEFPDLSDGRETPDEGEVTLAARTAGPAEDELRNKVAVFRGSGMVVQYVDMKDIAKYGADFHAVLACGQARTELGEEPSFVDEHVEQLLRAAEPAAHNEWTGTPRLKNKYSGRRVGTVEDLQGKQLRDELRELIAGSDDDAGERLESFEKFFPVGSSGGSSTEPSPTVQSELSRELHELVFQTDHWEVDVTLKRVGSEDDDEPTGWTGKVWLTRLFESGSDGERLAVANVKQTGGDTDGTCRVDDDGYAIVEADTPGTVRLKCESTSTGPPDPTSGRTGRTGVRHTLVTGGESS